MRKIIQISTAGIVGNDVNFDNNHITTALCDDGTVWWQGWNTGNLDGEWYKLPEILQDTHETEYTMNTTRAEKCLKACEGLPDDALDGGWTASGIIRYATRLDRAALRYSQRIAVLEAAIYLTIEENPHLADGDVCTLIHLKRALASNAEAHNTVVKAILSDKCLWVEHFSKANQSVYAKPNCLKGGEVVYPPYIVFSDYFKFCPYCGNEIEEIKDGE